MDIQTLYDRLNTEYRELLEVKREEYPNSVDYTIKKLKKTVFLDDMSILCADQLMMLFDLKFNVDISLTLMDVFDPTHLINVKRELM
jgi:hypothetical protein